MSDTLPITCCFTGHREFETAGFAEVGPLIVAAVRELYGEGYRRFLSGGARGFDLYAAAAVAALRSELPDIWIQLVIPFKNHDASWPLAERRQFETVRGLVDSTVTLSDSYSQSIYKTRNEWLVDRASTVVAFCEEGHRTGGTRYTISYAVKRGRRLLNLASPDYIALSRERNRILLR